VKPVSEEKQEVVLDKESEDNLITRIANALKGVGKKEEAEPSEDEILGGITDLIDAEIEKRVEAKLAEKPKEEPKKEEKPKETPPTPDDKDKQIADLQKKVEELTKKQAEPQAVVTPPKKEDQVSDIEEATEEVAKHPQEGFATIFESMFSKKEKK